MMHWFVAYDAAGLVLYLTDSQNMYELFSGATNRPFLLNTNFI
jgi:hypothetical protein